MSTDIVLMQYWLRVTRGAPSAGNAYVSSSQQATASVAPAAAARVRTEWALHCSGPYPSLRTLAAAVRVAAVCATYTLTHQTQHINTIDMLVSFSFCISVIVI